MKNTITHKSAIIKCPHCGAEYLPSEIYMPGAALGRPEDIVKDSFGRILYEDYQEGKEPDMLEHFICDYCEKPFVVEATITYRSFEEAPERDFQSQYVNLLD